MLLPCPQPKHSGFLNDTGRLFVGLSSSVTAGAVEFVGGLLDNTRSTMWSRCGVAVPMNFQICSCSADLAILPSLRLKARHLKRNGSETSLRRLLAN